MVKNMTEGSIPEHLITYAVPLILGNMFQLTYNAVDSIIVGRFIGKEALAAVGTASPVMNLIKALLKQTLRYGSVTALQQPGQPIGKLLIQGP